MVDKRYVTRLSSEKNRRYQGFEVLMFVVTEGRYTIMILTFWTLTQVLVNNVDPDQSHFTLDPLLYSKNISFKFSDNYIDFWVYELFGFLW